MIITIAGDAGAGKSTVAREVAKHLGYNFYSTGDLRGEIALRHGLTIDQLNVIGKTESWPHRECDDRTIEIGKAEDNLVFDSWLAWHFIPQSFKIYLTINEDEGARRIFANQRIDETPQSSVEGVKEMLRQRFTAWHSGVNKHYGVNVLDEKNYDLVIDTTALTPEEVVAKIILSLAEK